MARDHARINIAIWQDDDWRDLPTPAQHLYFTLWTHPLLNYAGIVDWRPGRLAGMANGWTVDEVEAAGDCLRARLFIVVDDDTEECLIRSFVRFDGLMKQPRMAVSFANAFAGTTSRTLRGVIVHEAHKLREIEPDLGGWAKPQVQELLTKRSIDPRTLDLPADPFRDGFTPGFTHSVTPGLGETRPDVKGSVSVPPTPAPTPAPITPAPSRSRRKPEHPIPADWSPNGNHREQARAQGVDVEREASAFRDHALANDRRLRDWDAGFRMWLTKARPAFGGSRPARRSNDDWMQGT